MSMRSSEKCVLTEKDLETKRGLKALEIHERLVVLARLDRRVESALCYQIQWEGPLRSKRQVTHEDELDA